MRPSLCPDRPLFSRLDVRFPANQICASYCSTIAGAVYSGVEAGTDCYCGAANEDYSKNGALAEEMCATLCESDPESTCGGVDAIEVRTRARVGCREYLGAESQSNSGRRCLSRPLGPQLHMFRRRARRDVFSRGLVVLAVSILHDFVLSRETWRTAKANLLRKTCPREHFMPRSGLSGLLWGNAVKD